MNCESRGVRNNAVVSELARTDGGTLGNTAVVTGVMQWRQDVSLTGPLSTPPPPKRVYFVQRWNDTDGGNRRTEKNLSQCHFIKHKSHMN